MVEIATTFGERQNQHYHNMAGYMGHSYFRVEGLVPLLGVAGTVELKRLWVALEGALAAVATAAAAAAAG